jgi:DNA-binding PadR family transcriptional regulator
MYRDNTLLPSEAVRLLALGVLANSALSYSELATEVRHFTSRIVGPSLDLVGTPLEVLKLEGLIESLDKSHGGPQPDEAGPLAVTEAGMKELQRLLASGVRAPITELNKLIIALKLRFLHFLKPKEQRLQIELLVEMSERELARLTDLGQHHAGEAGLLASWLDHEIAQARERLAWYRDQIA